MLFSTRSLSFALTLGLAAADVTPESTPVGSLYAYGSGLSGLPVIYSDGVAVLGWGQPSIATIATNLTFTQVNTSLIAQPNNTAMASNWTNQLLYIETQPGAMSDVAFTAANSTGSSNSSRATTGFEFYGRQLLWMGDEDSGAGRSFWASPLEGDEGFYKLFWNADNAALEDAVPVAIKRLPPPAMPDRV